MRVLVLADMAMCGPASGASSMPPRATAGATSAPPTGQAKPNGASNEGWRKLGAFFISRHDCCAHVSR